MKSNIDTAKATAEEIVSKAFSTKVLEQLLNEDFIIDFMVKSIYFSIRLITAVIIYRTGKVLLQKILSSYEGSKYFKNMDASFQSFAQSFLHLGVKVFMGIICLVFLGMKGSSLIAFLGTLGLGVGLALKDSLANLAGGIIILIFKTYSVNDYINVNGLAGTVKSINVFSTSINTLDNKVIIIPNGNIISSPIINYSAKRVRRVDITVSVSYDDDLEVAKKALAEMTASNEAILKSPEVQVLIGEYANSSINIFVRAWCETDDYWDVYYWLLDQVKPTLDKHNLTIPYPQMDIHQKKG